MNWADEIDLALRRSGSPFRAHDVIRWLRRGEATFAATHCLRGSVWFNPKGEAEIGHIAGRWCTHCADWLVSRLEDEMAARGCHKVNITGRKGWRRFLNERLNHGRSRISIDTTGPRRSGER